MKVHTFLFCFLLPLFSLAGTSDSSQLSIDTTIHSVKKAVLFSAVIPGAGQIYNHISMPKGKKRAYWKVPVIYGGIGTSIYFLAFNQREQKALKTEYSYRVNTGLQQNTDYANYSDIGVLTLYNQHLNWRDLSILAVASVYLIQLIDAGVEAHFVSFDISEDLGMSLEPTLLNNRTAGGKLSLNFH